MLIKEYRVIMPMTVEEYKIGQLWSIAEASRIETGGGDGVQVYKNEPFENFALLGDNYPTGQYTKKRYYLRNKVSGFVRTITPKKALILDEEAWNAFPYCKTVVRNEYFGNNFLITILSHHLPGRGELENVHQLPADRLKMREVVVIDIAGETVSADYNPDEDPKNFKSQKTGRGPLTPGWMNSSDPVMTCYKLVTCEFTKFGFQTIAEKKIQNFEQRIFTKFHRQLFVWMDHWFGFIMDEIRDLEDKTQRELEEQRETGEVRGFHVDD